ncbi:MAG: hypothetical protein DU480_11365 [Nitrosomonas sp.]|uniref:hypothetical protein n=1 Tax=Nitrosomonas sp. TaxID=42353 RepID=UPI0032ED2AAA
MNLSSENNNKCIATVLVPVLLTVLLATQATGCAINDKGFTQLRYFENATSYMTKQNTWGGFISTHSSDRGLTLGYAERIKVYPKMTNNAQLALDQFLQQTDNIDFVEGSAKEMDLQNLQPFAWFEKNQGVTLHANSLKIGLSAGVEARNVLRLPPDFDGIFIINRDSDGSIKAGVQRSLQQQ